MAVIAENGGHGSGVAAPIARTVIDEWLRIGKLQDTVLKSPAQEQEAEQ